MNKWLGAILIGGRSRRMGQPKHLLRRAGRTLLQRTADLLAASSDEVVVLGDGTLPDGCRLHQLADAPGYEGPLAGIRAGLRYAEDRRLLLAACDHPLLHPDALRWLMHAGGDRRGCVPLDATGTPQPLLAWYEATLADDLDRRQPLASMAARVLVDLPGVITPSIPEACVASWHSTNTPEEWSALPTEGEDD